MLQLAAAAAGEEFAERFDAIGRGAFDYDDASPFAVDFGTHRFAGQRIGNEECPALAMGDPLAATADAGDRKPHFTHGRRDRRWRCHNRCASAMRTGPGAMLERVRLEPSGTSRLTSGHFTPVEIEAREIGKGNDADAAPGRQIESR